MKNLLLAAALLLGLLPAHAQTSPALGPPAAAVAGATHADSLAVLHRVFHQGRVGGRVGTFLLAGATTLSVVSVANRPIDQSNFRTGVQSVVIADYAGLMVFDIVRWARFSQRREALAVQQFEEGQPLLAYVQREFKRIFAREMARQHRF
ncbi:hypothetical protein [Hymenobacter sp. PAMC 26628]|uniref:hypothetical protein n=1 Tax=Hymenobacter sp. PAMC 26628 TaxID=1484118 RepID=UPI00076FF3D0|nr:hypothetical protein [Hymenobacter sp. PAMC 26628]AMJ64075.1 hypothetical protein AXW84_00500 [Hymenobacter sp. PAMC 26628]